MKNKKIQEDEIPKSVLKMKLEKEKREKDEKKNNKHSRKKEKKSKKIIKKIMIIFILIILIIIGIIMGISAFTWKELTEEMFRNENSIIIDAEGNIIATLGSEQKKLKADFKNIPENLIDAYVSIEDERYYTHHGVDIKRTASAIASYIIHFGNSSYGGSTITQQLVKNLTGDNTDSIIRKVKEWWKAFLLETYFSKEDILEMYLNVIYVGPNIYGVQSGAKYYFDKDVSDLSLAECAFLAGINNSPNSYNPFEEDDNTQLIKDRTITVLQKMLELGYIEEKEYNNAIEDVNSGLEFEEGEIELQSSIYSYHTDALIAQVIDDLVENKNISESFATNYLYLAGLTIHSTQNSDIQDEVEAEFLKEQYQLYSSDGETTSQAAMIIIDHKTGKVLACTGGLGKKDTYRGLNRATQSMRQTGSAMKPLAVLVPGIDKKILTASTIYDDEETTFSSNYSPKNNDGYLGKITVRRALESSQNIPFVKMMEQITPRKAMTYLEDMGITSLTSGDENLALALGGIEQGITPLEMASAYATIANDGEYIEPIFYTSITNNFGKVIFKPNQINKRVFSEQVAYIVKELLKEPVEGNYGTATYCSISGIDVAAKTGTTDDNYDKWLCGFTPYYTAVTWFGYDQNETIYYNNQNPAGIIWANVMRSVHSGLTNAKFYQPSKIIEKYICADTGMEAKTGCVNTYIEYFLKGTEPAQCIQHSGNQLTIDMNNKENDITDIYIDNNEDLELDPNDEEEIKVNDNITKNEIIYDNNNDVEENIVKNILNNEVVNNIQEEENIIISSENDVENEIVENETIEDTMDIPKTDNMLN